VSDPLPPAARAELRRLEAKAARAHTLLGEAREELAEWIDGARSVPLNKATMLTIDGIDEWQAGHRRDLAPRPDAQEKT